MRVRKNVLRRMFEIHTDWSLLHFEVYTANFWKSSENSKRLSSLQFGGIELSHVSFCWESSHWHQLRSQLSCPHADKRFVNFVLVFLSFFQAWRLTPCPARTWSSASASAWITPPTSLTPSSTLKVKQKEIVPGLI